MAAAGTAEQQLGVDDRWTIGGRVDDGWSMTGRWVDDGWTIGGRWVDGGWTMDGRVDGWWTDRRFFDGQIRELGKGQRRGQGKIR